MKITPLELENSGGKMRKIILFMMLNILILAGCGNSNTLTDVSKDAERVQEATLDVWAPDGKNSDWLEYAVDAYNKEFNTDIKLNRVSVAGADVAGKLAPTLASGQEEPEIMFMMDKHFYQIYKDYPTAFVNLTEYGIADEIESEILPKKIEILENAADGDLYAFPHDLTPAVVFYRDDLFKQVGIDYEQDIKTLDDLIDAGEKVYQETGVQMFPSAAPADPEYFNILLQMQGVYKTDIDGNYIFNDENGVKALQNLYRIENSEATLFYTTADQENASKSNSSVLLSGNYWAGTNSSDHPENAGKWKMAPLPPVEEGQKQYSGVSGGSGWYVGANSNDAQAALQVLQWSLQDEDVLEKAIELNVSSANTIALQTDAATAVNDYYGIVLLELAQQEAAKIPEGIYYNFPYDTAEKVIQTETGYFLDTDGSPEEAQKALDTMVENIENS